MIGFKVLIQGLSLRPVQGFFGYSSVVLISDNGENILFDTGGYGVRVALQSLIGDIPIHKVFLSHLHFDHCANVALFRDAEIYVHRAELDNLHSKTGSIYSDVDDFLKRALDGLRVIPLVREEHISAGTRAVLTPGHTLGHSSLEILSQNQKTVVAGDAIETYQEYLDDSYPAECFDRATYLFSKKKLKDNYSMIVPGHAAVIENGILQNASLNLRYF